MRKTTVIISGLILVTLLAGGAFTAVRLLTAQTRAEQEYGPGVQVFEDVFDDGSGPVTVRTIVEPAPELPAEPAAAGGILIRVEDNSLFVGTGSTSVNVEIVNGERNVVTEHSGPELEVVLGRETRFYRDETDLSYDGTESVERRRQQVVREVEKPAEFLEGWGIVVWGSRSGDRITADVVVYQEEG